MKKLSTKATVTSLVIAALCASCLVTGFASSQSSANNEAAVKAIQSEYAKAKQNQAAMPITQDEFDNLVRQGVNSNALSMALKAYTWASNKGSLSNKRYLTIVDFSKPSNTPRMHVIDLKAAKIVFNEFVSQGAGSGKGPWATYFSDVGNSHASELGAIVTTETYYGKHGYSLRLAGLERTNSNISNRAVVMHSANYATESYAHMNNRLGNSWGCFAMDPTISTDVINVIKGGSLVFAYAPQLEGTHHYA